MQQLRFGFKFHLQQIPEILQPSWWCYKDLKLKMTKKMAGYAGWPVTREVTLRIKLVYAYQAALVLIQFHLCVFYDHEWKKYCFYYKTIFY